jgi:hypothetical protein
MYWPETIRQFRLEGVSGFELTTEHRANLRSKNGNAGVTTRDGTFYAGIGGGLVGSAANLRAVCWGDWQLKMAQDAEATLRAYDLESLADKSPRRSERVRLVWPAGSPRSRATTRTS